MKLFVSRAAADAEFAAVVGSILEDAGHSVVLQQWDFSNRNFMQQMHAALADGSRVVALLSTEYLCSEHCQAEWQNAIADDPLNTKSRLILLRVAECEPVGLLSGLAYWDLVPVRDDRGLLEHIVLEAVQEERLDGAPSGPYWRAPRTIVDPEAIRPVPSFSGREDELAAVAGALEYDGAVVAVHGLGGVGKSSIAREYAWRNRERYSVVWWLAAQTEETIIDGLLRLGALFVRGLDQLPDRLAAAQRVVASVLGGFAKPLLLIFDNLEDERLVRTWLPRTGARALVTSRSAAWDADVSAISLQTWDLCAATAYLRRHSNRSDLSEDDARTVVERLGGLPLALSHAAAALRNLRMLTPQRYLDRIGEYLKNAPRNAEYPQSVFATFSTAIAHAEAESPGAAALICFASCFAADAIPEELFTQPVDRYFAGLKPAVVDGDALELRALIPSELRLDGALGALDRLSLLTFAPSSRTYAMHRLVQLAARDLHGEVARAWHECAVATMEAAFPRVDFTAWPQCERLLPHARAALSALPEDATNLFAARLAARCGSYLYERGEYDGAAALELRALKIFETVLGPSHRDVAAASYQLSAIYYRQARHDEAVSRLTRALGIWEQNADSDELEVAMALVDLARLYHALGRFGEEESLFVRALEIQRRLLGNDHPAVASTLGAFAFFLNWQGRPDKARQLRQEALAIKERVLGPNHPDLAELLNEVGEGYYREGRYEEVESLLTRALNILEASLGPNHPDVAYVLNNLAAIAARKGRYDEAEALIARTLSIREMSLGTNHPDVAMAMHNLAQIYEDQGRFEEAAPLHERVLAIRENVLSADHTEIATSLSDVARMYELQGRFEEAQRLFARALAIREKALGSEHSLTRDVRQRIEALKS